MGAFVVTTKMLPYQIQPIENGLIIVVPSSSGEQGAAWW